ncbi:MAG: DUF3667 domain-containing protein [Brevundimonas sp.]|uniref:DUF3667 domain-containing protein n=1 Tax=Brevundimonas sp. TaxID=1871086 RepID=UPI00403423E4
MDIEGAGGAVTGGLVAAAVEKPTGHSGEAHVGVCSDCGAETSGNFCAHCGQPTHVHRTLLHLGEEVLHGVMHFDARIWRTLPLLAFNPGRLTREWVQGRRTRYVSPLAMFLFTIFVMFFALSFMPHPEARIEPLPQRIAAQRAAVIEADKAVATARAELETAGDAPGESGVASGMLAAAEGALLVQKSNLAKLEKEAVEGRKDGLQSGSWQAALADMNLQPTEGDKASGMTTTVLKKLKNPDLAVYKLQQTMYKFAFLLVPFSIPFMALLFLWKRGFTLYDHGVFVLYSLTFMALLMMVIVLAVTLNQSVGGMALAIASLAIPVHVFAQLKGAYSLRIFSALWRTVFLLTFCNIVVALFIVAIVYLGLGH